MRDLPVVRTSGNVHSEFAQCIGYVDIHLFRSRHKFRPSNSIRNHSVELSVLPSSAADIHRWLRLLRLHKYLFLFANMTYEQFICLNHENFDEFVVKVNVLTTTKGAMSKILREIDVLRQRRQQLEKIYYVRNILIYVPNIIIFLLHPLSPIDSIYSLDRLQFPIENFHDQLHSCKIPGIRQITMLEIGLLFRWSK